MKSEHKFLGNQSVVSNSVPTLVKASDILPLTWERYDFVFRGGFDIPQLLIYARRR